MTDRFKFRAWDRERKLLIYSWSESTTEQRKIYEDVYGKDETYNCWQCCQLDCLDDYGENFIIEQCTGLKDKNGKLIYENDLIKCPNGIYRIAVDDFGLWTAIYENNPLKDVVEWSDIVKNYAFNQENVELEVLGNIHENADLLEVNNDNR